MSGIAAISSMGIASSASAQVAAPVAKVSEKTAAKPAKSKPALAKFDAAATLNKAIRQAMLAERITKSFSLIGQNVLETRSRRQMEDMHSSILHEWLEENCLMR